MFIHAISSHNVTAPLPPLASSSNASLYPVFSYCYQYSSGAVIFPVFTLTNVLVLPPLHIFVLHVGVQRWRSQRSVHGAMRTSHTDLFTYHRVTMECFGVWALILFSWGIMTESDTLVTISIFLFCMFFPGQTLFDCLTCVERYLAVVHPMLYRRQKEKAAARIRNISIGSIWLQCFVYFGVAVWFSPHFPTVPFLCFLGLSIIIVSYCSLSILRILIRPGPGEVGRYRDGLDQSKQRAFRIITTILGALLLRFFGLFLCFGYLNLVSVSEDACVWLNSGIWFALPSSLVLPLLFLQRAGKLPCGRRSAEPE